MISASPLGSFDASVRCSGQTSATRNSANATGSNTTRARCSAVASRMTAHSVSATLPPEVLATGVVIGGTPVRGRA